MLSLTCVLLLVDALLISCEETTQKTDNIKTYVDYYRPPPSRNKPTTSTVEHEPGVPPGWPKRPTTTTQKPLNKIHDVSEIITTTSAPFVLNPNYTHEELINENQNRATFIEWLLGILGLGGGGGTPNPTQPLQEEPPKNCPKCTCGLTYKHKRIVGGVETEINQYPWMTALTYNNRFYCGASVINSKYLLTAAHCVNGFSKERLSAVFLDHDRSNHFETQTFSRDIKKILRHRYYGSGGAYNNDIALLQLDKELPITRLLRPVCLPQLGKSYTGYKGIAVGWGATQVHGQVSNKLREVEVPILSNIDCRRTGYGNKITDNMLCAGYSFGMKDSCQGDSGGPLHIVNNTYHHIIGIVSWGEGCAEPNFPGVYTRVNRYISWIRSNTKDACYC